MLCKSARPGIFLAMPLKKRSVAIELRLRAEAEARKEAAQKLKLIMIRFATGTLTLTTLLALVAFDVLGVFHLFPRHLILRRSLSLH